MKKILFTFITLIVLSASINLTNVIAVTSDYYSGVDTSLYGDAFINELNKVTNPTNLSIRNYNYAYYTGLPFVDEDPNNANNILCFYSGASIPKGNTASGTTTPGNNWNREHVWAKSHGFPNESDSKAYSDLFNLHATDVTINSTRGNLDFDICQGKSGVKNFASNHSYSESNWYTSSAFEPRDEVKGDVARTMFYMVVKYNDANLNLSLVDSYTSGSSDGTGTFGKLSTLLKWHAEDPVSEEEMLRNERVYSIQNNRNPFIDHPEYVLNIWTEYQISANIEVKFNTMGGSSLASVNIPYGTMLTPPVSPTKDGFMFIGWYKDVNCTQPFDFSTKLVTGLTLYAKWVEQTATLAEGIKASINFSYTTNTVLKTINSIDQLDKEKEYYLRGKINDTYYYYNGTVSSSKGQVTSDINNAKVIKVDLVKNATENYFALSFLTKSNKVNYFSGSGSSNTNVVNNTTIGTYSKWNFDVKNDATYISSISCDRALLLRKDTSSTIIGFYDNSNVSLTSKEYFVLELVTYELKITNTNNFAMRFMATFTNEEIASVGTLSDVYLIVCPTSLLSSGGIKDETNPQSKIIHTNIEMATSYVEGDYCFVGIVEDIPVTKLDTMLSIVCVVVGSNKTIYSNTASYSVNSIINIYYNRINDIELSFTDEQKKIIKFLYEN